MRVLHCPHNVGGNPWGLSRAERKLGLESKVMVLRSHPFGYPFDVSLHFEDKKPRFIKELRRLAFFLSALAKYDIFSFNFGDSLFTQHRLSLDHPDFPLLRSLGKKIIMTYQGCDARLKSHCLKHFQISACGECKVSACNGKLDEIKKRKIKKTISYAHKIFILNPDLIYSCPQAEFLPYANVDLEEWRPVKVRGRKKLTFRIVHSSSNRDIKGTKYIVEVCNRLRRENFPLELVLVENMSRAQAKEIYQTADIGIDQLLVGWYGGFAVELMALGKPVLCYLREEDLKFLPFKDKIPIVNTTAASLYENLRKLSEDSFLRRELGEKGRAYVEEIHDPLKIASKLIEIYYRL